MDQATCDCFIHNYQRKQVVRSKKVGFDTFRHLGMKPGDETSKSNMRTSWEIPSGYVKIAIENRDL